MTTPTADTQSERIVFLPVLTKARELEARALQAAFLAKAGFRVVLGHKSFIDYRARFASNALYFCPSLIPLAEPRLRAFRRRGHKIIGWDEEGLVYPDPHWYFSNRVGQGPAGLCDALVAWGPASAQDWRQTLPDNAPDPLPIGNGRIDLLREPFRRLHAQEAHTLRERFADYVLVNTNFDMVNHNDGPGALLRKMRKSGRLENPRDEERFAQWERFRQAMFDAFLTGLPELHDALGNINIIIRPHPSESPEPYLKLAQGRSRLIVEPPRGTVIPWIMGSRAVVHNSCTTAVESFMLDVPTIAYEPSGLDTAMESPLPNLLSIKAADWQEVAQHVREVFDAPHPGFGDSEQHAVARCYIGSIDGPSASEGLCALALALDRNMPQCQLGAPPPLRQMRRLAGEWAERLGMRTLHNGDDDLRRFPGLGRDEIERLVASIAPLVNTHLVVSPFERDTYLITRSQPARQP